MSLSLNDFKSMVGTHSLGYAGLVKDDQGHVTGLAKFGNHRISLLNDSQKTINRKLGGDSAFEIRTMFVQAIVRELGATLSRDALATITDSLLITTDDVNRKPLARREIKQVFERIDAFKFVESKIGDEVDKMKEMGLANFKGYPLKSITADVKQYYDSYAAVFGKFSGICRQTSDTSSSRKALGEFFLALGKADFQSAMKISDRLDKEAKEDARTKSSDKGEVKDADAACKTVALRIFLERNPQWLDWVKKTGDLREEVVGPLWVHAGELSKNDACAKFKGTDGERKAGVPYNKLSPEEQRDVETMMSHQNAYQMHQELSGILENIKLEELTGPWKGLDGAGKQAFFSKLSDENISLGVNSNYAAFKKELTDFFVDDFAQRVKSMTEEEAKECVKGCSEAKFDALWAAQGEHTLTLKDGKTITLKELINESKRI